MSNPTTPKFNRTSTTSTTSTTSSSTPPTPTKEKHIIPTKKDKKEEKKEEKKEKRVKEKLEKQQSKEKKKKERADKKESKKSKKSSGSGKSDKNGKESDSKDMESGQDVESEGNEEESALGTSGGKNSGSLVGSVGERKPQLGGIYSSDNQNLEVDENSTTAKIISESEIFSSESFLIAVSDTDHLGPAIKSVFENNKDREVIKSLNSYINQKDSDIEKICGDNHESFINSVQEFLGLKEENLELKQLVINLNYDLQEIGTKYSKKADELFAYKQIKDNIRKTKEIINNCQYVILLAMKIEEFIENRNYYHAIKNMDQLHNVYLKKLSDFQFARNMDYNIPLIKEQIKKEVKDSLNSWMVDIKEKSFIIGKLGMVQTAKKLEKEREINPLKIKTTFGENETTWDRILEIYDTGKSVIGSLLNSFNGNDTKMNNSSTGMSPPSPTLAHGKNLELLRIAEDNISREDFIQYSPFDAIDIDFHPLYQCLFIYSSLGLIEEFQAYYTLNRLLQFQLVIQPKEQNQDWEVFLQQIAGYFMVESKVIMSTEPFLSKSTIYDSWNSALVKVTSVLQELFTHCHDTKSLIAFKKFVLVFTDTMSYYSYHVQPLYYLLDTMKEKYCQFSIKEAVDKFNELLEKESHSPLIVETMEEYETLILSNNLDQKSDSKPSKDSNNNNELDNSDSNSKPIDLPKNFLFSRLVPQFYTLIKKFISEFYEFSDQLSENEDIIIRSTDILIKKINEVVYSYLSQSHTVAQVIQIVINLQHFIYACSFFKGYLNSLILGTNSENVLYGSTNSTLSESNKIQLSSQNLLFATKNHGEKLIIKLSDRKIEDFMTLADNINWTPHGHDDRPRDYITELCSFLDINLIFIQPLSHNLREEFITKAFKKISELLYNLLYSDQIKRINLAGIKDFNSDLKFIEDFVKQKASEKDRTTTSSRNLMDCFLELRQLVNLLISENPEEFADTKIRAKVYNLITNYPQLVMLMGKFKEEAKLFSSSKEKDRNNKISEAIKKINKL